ncbi:MAG: glycosyltransferase family 39 protein [Patescibacteria group bacterium]|nr:glycosyltransferase family 39 protein [Patescibacteria group bacterium]
MSYKVKNKFTILIILAILVLFGACLRLYRHDDFLHFQLDQARDAMVISKAVEEGLGELPLLGPRAAGTMLRLGPAFYYLEYLSAKLFGNSPAGMNGINLWLSIFSIPLIYLLFRWYFSRLTSVSITTIYTVSLFTVTYGRFAWNPNPLLFFVPSLLISLLLLAKGGNKRTQIWFIYLTAILLATTIQLHFLAFIVFPLLIFLFLLYQKLRDKFFTTAEKIPKISQHYWLHYLLAGVLILAINTPIFINEYLTQGDNTKEFFEAVVAKTEKNERYSQLEKLTRNAGKYAQGYFLIVTGVEKTKVPEVWFTKGSWIINTTADVVCDYTCRKRLPLMSVAVLFFMGGITFFLNDIIKLWKRKAKKESDLKKINFLVLNVLLFSITFFVFLSSAFKFPPRFLLTTFPVAFVFLGLWLEKLSSVVGIIAKKINAKITKQGISKIKAGLIILITLMLAYFNLMFVIERFISQSAAHTENYINVERDLVLKEDIRFTLLQQNLIVDWILENSNNNPIFVWAPPKYYRPFLYHLRYQRGRKNSRRLRCSAPCSQATYFAITRATAPDDFFEKDGKLFKAVISQNFGTFVAHKLILKDASSAEQEQCEPFTEKKAESYARRYTWKEAFNPASR